MAKKGQGNISVSVSVYPRLVSPWLSLSLSTASAIPEQTAPTMDTRTYLYYLRMTAHSWSLSQSESQPLNLWRVTVWASLRSNQAYIKPASKLTLHHYFIHLQRMYTNISRSHSAPPYTKQEESTRCLTKMLTKSLTCCGLQKQQGDETADQDCTLHDGCQENSDSHTDYIYQGRKVKGHAERRGGAQRGPAGGGAEICVSEVLQES